MAHHPVVQTKNVGALIGFLYILPHHALSFISCAFFQSNPYLSIFSLPLCSQLLPSLLDYCNSTLMYLHLFWPLSKSQDSIITRISWLSLLKTPDWLSNVFRMKAGFLNMAYESLHELHPAQVVLSYMSLHSLIWSLAISRSYAHCVLP